MAIAFPRRLRLSVRAFMLLVLILGAGLGWIIQRAKAQREAVEAIRESGGIVRYDRATDTESYFDGRPGKPALIKRFLGPEYFDDVTYVGFPSSPDVDPAMPYVRRLKRVEEVSLFETAVTDAGLAQLRGMDYLREISLGRTKVTGQGLAALADLPRLEIISSLDRVRLGDVGYRNLGRLTHLIALDLSSQMDSAAGLAHLKGLTRLRKLYLGSTLIDDASLEQILQFTDLEDLNIGNAQVTDAGLARLESLPRLRKINLSFTKVTPAGIAAFQARCPRVKIIHYP